MKTFRSTLVLALVVALVWGLVRWLDPAPPDVAQDELTPELFFFEKQDLVRFEVTRPDGTVIAAHETDDGWILEGTELRASKSMVNRVKHQLHDLVARAKVIEEPEDPALYGLGAQAIRVKVEFKNGWVREFLAGDPNPSQVSYYIQPVPGDQIFVVKKSAVDYYSFDLEDFRERRFATFDSKDVDRLTAKLEGHELLDLQRVGERTWEMLSPLEMDASRDEVRALLGRVSALKAMDFVEDLDDTSAETLATWGLDTPRAKIHIAFGGREPLDLLSGAPISTDPEEKLAYMTLEGEWTIYQAKHDLLNDYAEDPATFRNRRFVKLHHDDVVQVDVTLQAADYDDTAGEATIKRGVDEWHWGEDGRPVPGSTPERVAIRVTGLNAEEFVADAPGSLAPYGLDDPRARAVLHAEDGSTRTVLIGDRGPSRELEDRVVERYYATVEGETPVYLVDRGGIDVLEDVIREHTRKATKDDEIAERHEAMEEARKVASEDEG